MFPGSPLSPFGPTQIKVGLISILSTVFKASPEEIRSSPYDVLPTGPGCPSLPTGPGGPAEPGSPGDPVGPGGPLPAHKAESQDFLIKGAAPQEELA